MVAVLIDAVDSVTRYRSATDKLGRRVFAEDTEWFLGADDGRLYSFESICDVLNLDGAAVRAELRLAEGTVKAT
jgi:hypothetical protein